MTRLKFSMALPLFLLLFLFTISASAQVEEAIPEEDAQAEEQGESGSGGVMDTLFKALGNAAQDSLKEGIDDFIGTYKGHIGEVKFLERRGNAVVLEVKYEGVKRKDGVYVQGEILQWGEPLDGFKSTLSPLKGKSGSVVLTIGWEDQADSDWGISSEEQVTSDQIRLSLVRETNPERPFGELVYDLAKTWTDSSEIEVPEVAGSATDGAIELAEGETAETTQTVKPGIAAIRPGGITIQKGAVLKPSQVVTAKPSPATSSSTQKTEIPAKKSPYAASAITPVLKLNKPGTIYDMYKNAASASWKSSAGKLNFPGSTGDKQGFVLTMANGTICPNNKAKNLLETHPQWVEKGSIKGIYPRMVLGNNFKFKAVGAMLKGAANSDGVIMLVSVLHDNRIHHIVRKRVNCNAYQDLEADLSSWAGKEIQIILEVGAGKTSTQDWAVWVYPRLTNQ
ncbi:MAG: hypothetical protein JXL81_09025 [Deltaproteobacteria bacterium]|nr:hypothetical protein [Deltaproteobacteria bacterium]